MTCCWFATSGRGLRQQKITPNNTFTAPINQKNLFGWNDANAQEQFAMGDRVTWIDFVIAYSFEKLNSSVYGGKLPDSDKQLSDYKDRVLALPAVADYISKRPQTSF